MWGAGPTSSGRGVALLGRLLTVGICMHWVVVPHDTYHALCLMGPLTLPPVPCPALPAPLPWPWPAAAAAGYGVRDVAYLLCSSVDSSDLLLQRPHPYPHPEGTRGQAGNGLGSAGAGAGEGESGSGGGSSSGCSGGEASLLRYYHARLCVHLRALRPPAEAEAAVAAYSFGVMVGHFEAALLDYVRFMAGWGMWGAGLGWAEERARGIMARMA